VKKGGCRLSLNDWNHTDKKDGVDQFIDFQVYKETEKINNENGKVMK
jgi:hypothetical protein